MKSEDTIRGRIEELEGKIGDKDLKDEKHEIAVLEWVLDE